MAAHQVLFCPFCRESFEGVSRCPEHELELVSFDRLPAANHEHDLEDTGDLSPLAPWWDPRSSRGMVAVSGLLNGAALSFPLGWAAEEPLGAHSALALSQVFPVLWTLILVSFTIFFVLFRRRSPAALASVRLLVPALAPVSPIALAIVGQRLGHGPWAWLLGDGRGPGPAVLLVLLASLLMVVGGVRLGIAPARDDRRGYD